VFEVTGVLDHVSRAERLLAEASTAEEAKEVIDAASFAADLSRRIGLSTHSVNHALLIKAKAMRRLADIVDEGQARGEIASQGRPKNPRGSGVSPAPLPVPNQRLAEARRIRDTFTDEDLERQFAAASERDKELPTGKLVAVAKHAEREQEKRVREQDRAATAPKVAEVSLSTWQEWLPQQGSCDLLLTDPPYSTDVDDVHEFARSWLPLALGKVKSTGRAYVCIGAYPAELAAYLAVQPPAELELAQVLVWTYRNTLGPTPSHDYKLNWQAILYYRGAEAPPLDSPEMVEQFSVQDISAPDGRHGDRWHPWQKPDELAERLIRHSTARDATVIDPFAGTGTFILAAARLGRDGRGCELRDETLAIAEERGCKRVR
jgi:hypothetical protein